MHDRDQPKPPAEWLHRIYEAGHWERLIEVASESLAVDPDDTYTHRLIAWAYLHTDRPAEANKHVSFVVGASPNDRDAHYLAGIYYLRTGRYSSAEIHTKTLLRLAPEWAPTHYLAAKVAWGFGDRRKAGEHNRLALQLDPDLVSAHHLQVWMDGLQKVGLSHVWPRIRNLEALLSRDPTNAWLFATLGKIYLKELDRPSEAERVFRQALTLDPHDKDPQALLLESIHIRSLLYRTFSLPARILRWDLFRASVNRDNAGPWFLGVLAMPFLCVWLWTVGIFFVPAAWLYRLLILEEPPRTRPRSRMLAPPEAFRAWPLRVRIPLCLALIVGLWTFSLWRYGGMTLPSALRLIGWTVGIHLVLVCLWVKITRWRVAAAEARYLHQCRQPFSAR